MELLAGSMEELSERMELLAGNRKELSGRMELFGSSVVDAGMVVLLYSLCGEVVVSEATAVGCCSGSQRWLTSSIRVR
jgi:hypothetical protein